MALGVVHVAARHGVVLGGGGEGVCGTCERDDGVITTDEWALVSVTRPSSLLQRSLVPSGRISMFVCLSQNSSKQPRKATERMKEARGVKSCKVTQVILMIFVL